MISKGAKLTLDKAIKIARPFESSQAQLTALVPENADGSIHLVQKQDKEKRAQDSQQQNHPLPYQPNLPREQDHAETVVTLMTRPPGVQHVVRHVSFVRRWDTSQRSVSQNAADNGFMLWKVQRALPPHPPLKISSLSLSPSQI